MNALINATPNQTMSSREIAELTGKEHKNVLVDCRTMFAELELDELSFQHIYFDSMNRQQTEYLLTFDLVQTLVTGYSIKLRHAVIQRLNFLESKVAQPFDMNQLIANPAMVIELISGLSARALSLENEKIVLNKTIATITNTDGGIKFQQACKILGVTQSVLAKWLRDHGWDRYLNKARASSAYAEERGYCMTKYEHKQGVKPSGEPYDYNCVEFFILPKGMARIAKEMQKGDAA